MASRKRQGGPTARDRLLDAAERLFAERGFHGVSIRDITQAADADLSLVNYHFGDKRGLLKAVVERRAEILNRERLERLDAVPRDQAGRPDVQAAIDAFVDPLILRSAHGGLGWKSYFALIAQLNNSPTLSPLITEHFDTVVHRFVAVLSEAFPGIDAQDIYWGYHFLTGALTLTFAETGRLDKLSKRLCRSSDLEAAHARFARFMAGGLAALTEGHPSSPPTHGNVDRAHAKPALRVARKDPPAASQAARSKPKRR